MQSDMFRKSYGEVFDGDERWNGLEVPTGDRFAWDEHSTYVRQPPYFEGLPPEPTPVEDVEGARVLAKLGDSVTTDHISPAGSIKEDGPAGRLPQGARRREARLQLLRLAARQPRGDDARHLRQHPPAQPARAGHRGRRDQRRTARRCRSTTRRWPTPKRARRWSSSAARSTARARRATGRPRARTCSASGRSSPSPSSASTARTSSGMGVLPLQYPDGESAESLGLTGEEEFSITGLAEPLNAGELPRTRLGARGRHGVRGARAHRHAQGGGLLPPRRDPAVRAALADGERRLMPARPHLRRHAALARAAPRGAARDRRPVPLPRDRWPPGGPHQRARGRPHRPAGAGARAPARRAVRPRRAHRRRAVVRGDRSRAVRPRRARARDRRGRGAARLPARGGRSPARRGRRADAPTTSSSSSAGAARPTPSWPASAAPRTPRWRAWRSAPACCARPRSTARAALRGRGADLRDAARARPRGVRAPRRAGARRHHRGAHAPRRRRRPRGRQRAAARARPDLPGPVAAGRGLGLLGRHDAHVGARRHLRRGGRPAPARARGPRALARGRRGPACPASTSTARRATCSRPPGIPTQRTKKPGETLQHGFFFGLGHGVGLEVHEAPALGRTGRAPLIAGDVVAVEPGTVDPEHGGMRVEDLVLVTDDGYELLTERSYDLVP